MSALLLLLIAPVAAVVGAVALADVAARHREASTRRRCPAAAYCAITLGRLARLDRDAQPPEIPGRRAVEIATWPIPTVNPPTPLRRYIRPENR